MGELTFKEAVDLVFKELEEMPQDEFDKMIKEHENTPLTRVLRYAWKEMKDYDKCATCGITTPYKKDTHISMRMYYREGAGQLCEACGKTY